MLHFIRCVYIATVRMDKLILQAVEEVALEGPEGVKLGRHLIGRPSRMACSAVLVFRLHRASAVEPAGQQSAHRSREVDNVRKTAYTS